MQNPFQVEILAGRGLQKMYLDYFSLERHPFRITPDPSLFFAGGDQGRGVVLAAMLYAIENGEGILKVVGEVGSGKTMLCRMLEERLPESTEVVYLANPKLSPDEILYAVAFELKLPKKREPSRLLVMQQLQKYLLKQHAANRKVLVVIEEAQSMPFETLEEIRLLSNLETHRDKLMQIILFGQPELDKNLSERNIRQLRERITHSFYLNPLTPKEVAAYIRFRLGAAGCPCPQLLTQRAERLIARASTGLTRRINILVDKALLSAYSDNVLMSGEKLSLGSIPVIERKHVAEAISDSAYPRSIMQLLFSPWRLLGASMMMLIVATTFLLWPNTSGVASQASIDQQFTASYGANSTLVEASELQALALSTAVRPNPQAQVEDDVGRSRGRRIEALGVETDAQAVETQAPAHLASQTIDGSAQTANPRELTRARIMASLEWLHGADRKGYTIQLISNETKNLDLAGRFLATLDSVDLIAESYVCISTGINKSIWTIKYGSFSDLISAQSFIDELPAIVRDLKPFVVNMSAVDCNTNTTIAALILE